MAIFVSFPFLFSSFPFTYQLGMWVIKVSNVWRTIITFFSNILAIWSIPSCTISCENKTLNSKLALTNFIYGLHYKNTKFKLTLMGPLSCWSKYMGDIKYSPNELCPTHFWNCLFAPYIPSYLNRFLFLFFKFQLVCHVTIFNCATCHNLRPYRINNHNEWWRSIFQKKVIFVKIFS
jgi:hypothetical protein